MIRSIKFRDTEDRGKYSYVSELDGIKELGGEIEFTDGLNIIVGPNGSGKSSLLNVISHQLAANITGVSLVSKSWIQSLDFGGLLADEQKLTTYADIAHDALPVMYCSPRQGISAIVNQIDKDEFAYEVMMDQFGGSKESTGEKNNRLITPFIESVLKSDDHPDEISTNLDFSGLNDLWQDRFKIVVNEWLAPTIPKGKPTLILDEPETGLGILNQILLWKKLLSNPEVLEKFQIILVSHSHESINVPGANYIELKPGYLDTCRRALEGDFVEEEIQHQATKLVKPLNKRQHDMLMLIDTSETGEVLYKGTKTQDFLIEKDFIDTYRQNKKRKGRGSRFSSVLDNDYFCVLTPKGKQYLNMHVKKD